MAACVLVAADLLQIGMGINPAIPVEHAKQPATETIQRLQAARPARFAGLAPELGLQPLVPDTAMRYGLYDARGYDYPIERRYDTLWQRAVAPPRGFTPPTLLVEPDDESLRVLGLLGVTDVIQPPGEPRVPGWEVSYEGDDARLYANPHAVPRAWVVAGQRTVAGEDAALDAILDPAFDPRRTAIVERPVAGLGDDPAEGGEARIVRYEPDRVELVGDRRPALARGALRRALPGLAGDGRRPRGADRAGRLPAARRAGRRRDRTGSCSPTGPRAGGSAGS